MDVPLTIVIPTYNRSDLLQNAINSTLMQLSPKEELIVIDDGSIDATQTIVEACLQQANVHYVWQPNQGRSEARNHGARLARGTWLGFLDSDDTYTPNALDQVRSAANTHSEIGLLVGGRNVIGPDGRIIERANAWTIKSDLTLRGWLLSCYGTPSSIFIRHDWFDLAGGYDRTYETAEDWDLYLRLARLGCPMMTLPLPVCNYRRHPGNSTRAIENHAVAGIKALERQFSDTELGDDLKPLRSRAHASFYVAMAAGAIEVGDRDVASNLLTRASHADPGYLHECRITILESLLAIQQRAQQPQDAQQLLREILPPKLTVSRRDISRAQARVAMRHFFETQNENSEVAWGALKRALSLDPRWLLNGGILSFLAKTRMGLGNSDARCSQRESSEISHQEGYPR